MKTGVIVIKAHTEEDLKKIYQIRRTVFIEEQNCPPELEWEYEEESVHFLATIDKTPCGAARWRKTGDGFKLERFAVLKEYRKSGVGSQLLKSILADLPVPHMRETNDKVYLNAQLSAIDFYRRHGFVPSGEIFDEAGIQHRQMYLAGPDL